MKNLNISNAVRILASIVSVFLFLYAPFLSAQDEPNPGLLKAIMEIWATDNHSHVATFPYDTSRHSTSEDPLGEAPFSYPVRLRIDNPEYIKAWQVLYGYSWNDMKVEHTKEILKTKRLLIKEKGESWPAWVLDKVFIRTTFVNGPRLEAVQQTKRFRWVPHAGVLVVPFLTSGDTIKVKKGIIQIMAQLKLSVMPESLEDYTAMIITPVLQRWKEQGAIAVKIALAYTRALDFKNVKETDAERVYSALLKAEPVSENEYKELQDYLFCYLARESGSLSLPVHIHTGIGADPYFNVSGSNPLLLEPVLNDSTMRNTTFVLIHGGWPFEKEAGVLTVKPNVYIDFSAQTFLRSPRALSETLREWLEWYPEKILFGTDAYSDLNTPLSDWEEKIWLSNYSGRMALAIALTEMMKDKEISKKKAVELARMVLQENAVKLYKLEKE